jgi:hypothetical protein
MLADCRQKPHTTVETINVHPPDVRTKVKEGGSRQKLQPYTSDEVVQGATEGTVHVRPGRLLLDSGRTARKLKLTFGALDELLRKQLEGLPQTNAGRGRSRSPGSAVTLFFLFPPTPTRNKGVLLKKLKKKNLVVDKLANQVQVEGKSTEVPLQALGVEHNKRREENGTSLHIGCLKVILLCRIEIS